MEKKKIVIALGGNALQRKSITATAESQLKIVENTVKYIADVIEDGHEVIVVHGNGPQVGRIILQNEGASHITPAMPFDVCGAFSQGYIGYHIQQALKNEFRRRNMEKVVCTVVTQVLVDKDDEAFQNPTKPIGPFYCKEEAKKIASEKGYIVKEDAGRGWRRVVPSPMPKEIIEINAVKHLIEVGAIVVTVGGGGIPVVKKNDGGYVGTAAVIDKDFASQKLAEDIHADILFILTAVEKVAVNFGKPDEKWLADLTVKEAEKYMEERHFAPGSMLPKVKAAVNFVKGKKGKKAIITSLEKALKALHGETGTVIYDEAL